MLEKYAAVFLIAMVPLIELRGALPVAAAWGLLPPGEPLVVMRTYALCTVGNMLPVPVIYLFARRVLAWGARRRGIGRACTFFLTKGAAAGRRLEAKAGHGLFVALLLFVGIPLPGTGAWTGTLAASLLGVGFRKTTLAVMCGVLLAGTIMMLASMGVLGGVSAISAGAR